MKMFETKSIVFKGDGKITFNILRMIFCCFTTTSRETKFRYQLTKQAIISLPIRYEYHRLSHGIRQKRCTHDSTVQPSL